MKDEQPADVSKARELLRKYEQAPNHKERIHYFKNALDLLEPYRSDEPDSHVGHVAKNIRRTYIKKLLESLPSLSTLDIDEWSEYFMLLFLKQSDEVESLCQENAMLNKYYKDFIRIWGQEVINALQKLCTGH